MTGVYYLHNKVENESAGNSDDLCANHEHMRRQMAKIHEMLQRRESIEREDKKSTYETKVTSGIRRKGEFRIQIVQINSVSSLGAEPYISRHEALCESQTTGV